MRASCLLLSLLTACYVGDDATPKDSGEDEDTGDTGEDNGTGGDRTFEDFVDVSTAWVGDTTCFDPAAGTWIEQTVDPTCQAPLAINGQLEDFESGDSVPSATIQVWLDDDVSGTPDVVTAAGEDGAFEVEVQSCSPFGYVTGTPPEWEETVDTYEVHQIYGYSQDGVSATFNSVAESTARVIAGLVGVQWDRATGVIAGTAYDCNEDPIEYAQVFIHDGSGTPPETADIFYFTDMDMPTDRDNQPSTNTNGLWVALNVPEGTWTAEMWGWDGTQLVMLGATELQITAGSVNISNIYTGVGDGIWYPPSCQTACDG